MKLHNYNITINSINYVKESSKSSLKFQIFSVEGLVSLKHVLHTEGLVSFSDIKYSYFYCWKESYKPIN